jgi:hypothetical protein
VRTLIGKEYLTRTKHSRQPWIEADKPNQLHVENAGPVPPKNSRAVAQRLNVRLNCVPDDLD